MQLYRTFFQKVIALFLITAFLLTCTPGVFAYEALSTDTVNGIPVSSGDTGAKQTVTARYLETNSCRMVDFDVPYTDSFFERDSSIFYQDLAQASFGMTASAFRDGTDEGAAADANIRSFFAQAGFEKIQSYDYDITPTESSFGCVIASKKIGSETVIAFAGCGEGYQTEWISNLTIGTGNEHEGFSAAADLCEERLLAYLDQNEIRGDIRLWISGNSRASAVCNLLAGRLMETDLFTAIYGYFFATPNNTQSPVAYDNLFNIVGQNDPVAQLPLTSWGYGRNGRDLYTLAQESDSSFIAAAGNADTVMYEIAGISFRNNPDLNYQLHVVLEYLGAIFPTVEDFAETLQPQLISVYRDHSEQELLVLLREALSGIEDFSLEQQEAVNALINYLDEVIYQYISGNEQQQNDGSWNGDITLSCNVALEHVPSTYLAWIFSADDPSALYTGSTSTKRLVIDGSFALEVWDDSGIVQSITSSNEETAYIPGGERRPEDADLVYLYESNLDGVAIVNLPCDRDYSLRLKISERGTVSLFSNYYAAGDMENEVSDLVLFQVKAGEEITLKDFRTPDMVKVYREDGSVAASIHQTLSSDTESITARESLMNSRYTVRDILILSCILLILPLILLLAILVSFLRGRKTGKGRLAITICLGLLTLIYASGAVMMAQILPNVRSGPMILGLMSAVSGILVLIRSFLNHAKRPVPEQSSH